MSPPLIISVSGLRGIIGHSLTPQVALEFAQAFGHFLKTQSPSSSPLTVALGRDSRPSGPLIQSALTAGLLSVGINVIDVGVATTPSVALLGRYLKTSASIVITASHNPIQWNGIKTLRHDGIAYPPDQAAQIKKIYLEKSWQLTNTPQTLTNLLSPPGKTEGSRRGPGGVEEGSNPEKPGENSKNPPPNPAPALADIDHIGIFSTDSRAHAHHIQTVLALFDVKGIAHQRYRVVLDSVNGAGCIGTPMLLSKLGCEVIHLNGEATGRFAHTPEPTRENLTGLADEVRRRRFAVGFAQDPDADRLAIVDELGNYIGEEYTLALGTLARLLAKGTSTKTNGGGVVANLSSSRMVDDIAARFGQKVYRTPVGEANVASKMIEVNALIGGEGNGGIIDLRVGPIRDSFLGIATILDLLHRTGKTISQLVAEIPAYAMIKTKFECTPEQSAALVKKVIAKYTNVPGITLDTQDGIRIDWPMTETSGGWVQVRQSNTEPIARIIAEARDEKTAQHLIAEIQALRS